MAENQDEISRLREEHERLSLVLASSQLGLWDWNFTTNVVEIDNRWMEMLGYQPQDLLPFTIDRFLELCHPDDREAVDTAINHHIANKSPYYQVEIRLKNASGEYQWIKSTGKIANRTDKGQPLRMTGVHEDVTEIVNERIRGDIARSQLESAQRLGGLGSWYLDLATDEVTWSDELFRMQGLEPDITPPPASQHHLLFSPASWEKLSAALGETISKGKPYELELEMFNNNKFHGWMLARGEAIRDRMGDIVGVLGVAIDITLRKSKEMELENQALLDPLTQLGNRTSLDLNLDEAMTLSRKSGEPFAVLMVDIDHFKEINDDFGHDIGDDALVKLGQRLRSSLRQGDQIFRIGGDEFVVLMRNSMSADKALEVSERICEAFRKPLLELEQPLVATVSVGLVRWDLEEDSKELLRRADEALYKAKSLGRNQVYSPIA